MTATLGNLPLAGDPDLRRIANPETDSDTALVSRPRDPGVAPDVGAVTAPAPLWQVGTHPVAAAIAAAAHPLVVKRQSYCGANIFNLCPRLRLVSS